ncbi:MAG TPA: DUF58 domain-containing protein [Thermodesulfobacteriota bacterium]
MRRVARLWRRAVRLAGRLVRPPRTIRFTRDGVKFVVVALAIGVAAINTGNNLLYLVLAMMLSFIILSGILSEVTMRGITVSRDVPTTAVAGQPVAVRVGVTNGKRWAPSFSLAVHDLLARGGRRGAGAPAPEGPPRTYFLRVAPGETVWRHYTYTFARRGRTRFAGFRLATRYPFGLFLKSGLVEGPGEVIVLPPVDPVAAPPSGESQTAGDRPVARRGHGSTPSGLREYRPGDEPRTIHWRRSAALGDLVVREFDRDDRDRVLVALATVFPEGARSRPRFEERFEAAVRRAASLAAHYLERGYEVELRTGGGVVPLGTGARQRQAILTTLALVEPTFARTAPLPPAGAGMLPVLVTPDASLHAAEELAAYRHVEAPSL